MAKERKFYDFDLRKEAAANELKLDAFNMIYSVMKDESMTAEAKNSSMSCLIAAAVQAVDKIQAI